MQTRHYFLDWVRILAFFLLIFYHTGMYYVSWDWHVKSPYASDALEPFMWLTSPWRLGLLFFISGVASRFLLAKSSPIAFARQRGRRLLVPLLFGMFFIVPLQSYCEVVEKVHYSGSYLDFMRLYVTGYHGFCRGADCLLLPTWNHLWFLAYLWPFTWALALIALAFPQRGWTDRVARQLTGWKALVLPALAMFAIRMTLLSRFPTTHDFIHDWFDNAKYFLMFMLGYALAQDGPVWARFEQLRWHALALSVAAWAFLIWYFALPEESVQAGWIGALRTFQRFVFALDQWAPVVAACGFAHRCLNRDSAARRYLAPAVFPFYILHQTLIVAMAHYAKPLQLPPAVEGPLLVIATFALCFAGYEIVRRVPLLRPLFGLAPVTLAQARVHGEPAMPLRPLWWGRRKVRP
ncbi:MAG: acyltransferase family protein [Telluria sp.]